MVNTQARDYHLSGYVLQKPEYIDELTELPNYERTHWLNTQNGLGSNDSSIT